MTKDKISEVKPGAGSRRLSPGYDGRGADLSKSPRKNLFSTRICWNKFLAGFDLFDMFTQSIKVSAALFNKSYEKMWDGFCLYTGKHILEEVFLKTNRNTLGLSKNLTKDFWNIPLLERSACFQYLNFEKSFLKNQNLPFKNWSKVESTKIESTTFPYKPTLSKANVKTNWTGSTKWTNRIEQSFATNYVIFL